MKLLYQYMVIFFNFSPTSSHLHPLQVENCDSNSRLVVDEDDNGKVRLERVKVNPRDVLNLSHAIHDVLGETWISSHHCWWWCASVLCLLGVSVLLQVTSLISKMFYLLWSHAKARMFHNNAFLFCHSDEADVFCSPIYTLNNIGSFKRTLQYYYHATPG